MSTTKEIVDFSLFLKRSILLLHIQNDNGLLSPTSKDFIFYQDFSSASAPIALFISGPTIRGRLSKGRKRIFMLNKRNFRKIPRKWLKFFLIENMGGRGKGAVIFSFALWNNCGCKGEYLSLHFILWIRASGFSRIWKINFKRKLWKFLNGKADGSFKFFMTSTKSNNIYIQRKNVSAKKKFHQNCERIGRTC